MVLMISAAGVGLLWYFLGESKQRRAFLEAKKSLEVKMLIEEQSAEQVRSATILLFHLVVVIRTATLFGTNQSSIQAGHSLNGEKKRKTTFKSGW